MVQVPKMTRRTSFNDTINALKNGLWLVGLVVLDSDGNVLPHETLHGIIHQLTIAIGGHLNICERILREAMLVTVGSGLVHVDGVAVLSVLSVLSVIFEALWTVQQKGGDD